MAEELASNYWRGQETFLLRKLSRFSLELNHTPFQWVPEVQRLEHLPAGTKVHAWCCNSTSPCAFMV